MRAVALVALSWFGVGCSGTGDKSSKPEETDISDVTDLVWTDATDSTDTTDVPGPSSCAELEGPDGDYAITIGGHSLTVYCHDMEHGGREYLTLPDGNFSQYTSNYIGEGPVRTTWQRIRLDPATLLVDMADFTFSTSSGSLSHDGGLVDHMPYGVAMSCSFDNGLAHVDLTGTALVVDDTWVVGGSGATGDSVVSAGGQVVDVTATGGCGWNYPGAAYNPFNDAAGSDLQLGWP